MEHPPLSGINSIPALIRCYVRNYRGLSQKKQSKKKHHFGPSKKPCNFRTSNKKNDDAKIQVPQVEASSSASNSSVETRRQHPVTCNRRVALPPDHKVFLGTFLHQVENRETKTQGWVFCLWYIWHLVGGRWSDFRGICLLYLSERVSVKNQLIQVLKYLNCCVSGWGWSMLIPWIDSIGWQRWSVQSIVVFWLLHVIDDYRPKNWHNPLKVSHPKRENYSISKHPFSGAKNSKLLVLKGNSSTFVGKAGRLRTNPSTWSWKATKSTLYDDGIIGR